MSKQIPTSPPTGETAHVVGSVDGWMTDSCLYEWKDVQPNLPTLPTTVVRLSFVLGETKDLSLSSRLLSLEITATLKPLHTQHTSDATLIYTADRQNQNL